ncbi:PML-RARA-regulated adapter molecule 1 [Elephas maximus indicus]|uniref:PML-RARA-regulated adapter molecule 1 n=1 Tax=Elephas maximus indicus TaxID=99487 RepID=UPI0021161412|nr:PML-RARA-regulated adapter molecule 1 [Elephas maximus indicus]
MRVGTSCGVTKWVIHHHLPSPSPFHLNHDLLILIYQALWSLGNPGLSQPSWGLDQRRFRPLAGVLVFPRGDPDPLALPTGRVRQRNGCLRVNSDSWRPRVRAELCALGFPVADLPEADGIWKLEQKELEKRGMRGGGRQGYREDTITERGLWGQQAGETRQSGAQVLLEGHQDFRSLQAKFQASQPEPSELPKKPPKLEFNKLPKFPQPVPGEHPKKASQPEFTDHPRKPSQPEFSAGPKKASQPEFPDHPKKPSQPEFSAGPKKASQPEFTDYPRKPLKPEFIAGPKKASQAEFTDHPRKPLQPEFSAGPKKASQPEFTDHPKMPSQPEFNAGPKKASQPEFTDHPRKPSQPEFSAGPKKLPPLEACPFPKKPEFSEASRKPLQLEPSKPSSEPKSTAFPRKPWPPESSEAAPKPPQPEFGTFPKKPESGVYPRKPPQPQLSGLPKKPLLQPEFTEVPQTLPSRLEPGEPHPHPSKPTLGASPKKGPQPQLGECARMSPEPEFGDLTRTASEPEFGVFPKKPQQPEFQALIKKAPQAELGTLPRTASEPEFGLLPKKFPQPEGHGLTRKFSQAEAGSLPRKRTQAGFFSDLSRKPLLPSSVSESSLPTAVGGTSPRFPLGPGFGPRPAGQGRPGGLAYSGGVRLGLGPGHPPRRRPLPPASSLGPPPPKPPLPPGPPDIQSFRRPSMAAATALHKSHSFTGINFQARQPKAISQEPEGIYELYDDVEQEDSSPSPGSRDEVAAPQQARKRPPQDPEARKEKAPQPQHLPPVDQKTLKQMRKAEKAEREFRKKFKFEGEIVIQTKMMIDPNAKTRRGGGKHLGIRRGEILEVIEFTNKDEMLCRDTKGKYGYVPRIALLPLETEVYDDVGFWDPLASQLPPRGQ